ncbi:MAG: site-specific integrase [Methylococcales bacterium]|jgi:integrase|nr:site-specific integrase [Methylococcales bacterium]MBT7443318.1 site-specific integrase [Methylococcales bacterium]
MRHNLKNFDVKEVCSLSDHKLETTYDIYNPETGELYQVGEKPLKVYATHSFTAKSLPTVIGKNGLPWDLACYYLTHLTLYQVSDPASIQKYAVHLSEFYDFAISDDIDPLLDTLSKRKKPIFRFRDQLLASVRDGEITDRTANNKIGNVVRFYRWLVDDYGYIFKHRPFNNDSLFISYVTRSGNIDHKLVNSHDARIKTYSKSELPSENIIVDDGHLRPLPPVEQLALLNILETNKNTEMLLIVLFALTTGARIQSILTLRHKCFRVITDPDSSVPLAIGHGTSVDSKYSKKQTLIIPSFVHQKLATYSHSERSKNRFKKYCELRNIKPSKERMWECYLFLSNRGHPFYDSKSDLYKADQSQVRTNLRNGDSVRKFIKQHLLPPMKKAFGEHYHFRFHDLRATFGMNLVDACNKLVDEKKMTGSEVLPFVQSRMNHADQKTTKSYINYHTKNEQAAMVIEEHQNTLLDRIDALLGKTLSKLDPNVVKLKNKMSAGVENA